MDLGRRYEAQPIERQWGPSAPSAEEVVSRQIISCYRQKLGWLLLVPHWEDLLAEGLEELELPGPRKGIGLRPAINALLIENKFLLIRWTILHYRRLMPSSFADRISRDFGLEFFNSLDIDEHLTATQWARFQESLLFALGKEHRRYKNAQRILFLDYRPIVERTVNRLVFDEEKRHDCFQEGCLALLHAIDKVDDGNASLAAYAHAWIRRHVKNYLMGERFAVHVPINLVSQTLRHENTGEKSAPGIRDRARIMERLRQPTLSFDETFEDSVPLAEKVADDTMPSPLLQTSRRDIQELVAKLIASLTDKQRKVLELRYGLNGRGECKTLAEISKAIGISHQQVSMREKRALEKLGKSLLPYLAEIQG